MKSTKLLPYAIIFRYMYGQSSAIHLVMQNQMRIEAKKATNSTRANSRSEVRVRSRHECNIRVLQENATCLYMDR
jgi:hypothetical protein